MPKPKPKDPDKRSPMFGTIEMGGAVYECDDITMESSVASDAMSGPQRFRVKVVVGESEMMVAASVGRARQVIEAVARETVSDVGLVQIARAREMLHEDRAQIDRTLALLEQAETVLKGRLRAEQVLRELDAH